MRSKASIYTQNSKSKHYQCAVLIYYFKSMIPNHNHNPLMTIHAEIEAFLQLLGVQDSHHSKCQECQDFASCGDAAFKLNQIIWLGAPGAMNKLTTMRGGTLSPERNELLLCIKNTSRGAKMFIT